MPNIAVIGAGVIGLTTAVELQKRIRNARIVIFTEKLSPNTTGDISAGLWTPYLLEDTPQEDIKKWAKITQDYMMDLWKKGKSAEAGLCLLPIICATPENTPIPEWSEMAIGFQKLDERFLQKLIKDHKKKYRSGYAYMAFTMEPSKYLPLIEKEFLANGGRIELRKIDDIEELVDYDVVVNCSGLSAKILASDNNVKPIRGQVARVEAPWQFCIYMDDSPDGNYIIPNTNCVIFGGTHQHEDDVMVRKGDTKFIFDGCHNMVPTMKNAKIINHQVGLRPGRCRVRVETEMRRSGEKLMKIVHNYGHGGSGVTLCVGCAKDACDLVINALNMTSKL